MQDPLGLAKLMGGREKMKTKLDKYFNGGHNEYVFSYPSFSGRTYAKASFRRNQPLK